MCSTKKYDQICVVENIADMWAIQNSGIYKGHYHILGGTLPSFEGKKTSKGLLIESLVNRVKKNNLKLIEDCSHAHGALYDNKKVGSFSDISCFSLQGAKAIKAGEGGIALTNNKNFLLRMLIQTII